MPQLPSSTRGLCAHLPQAPPDSGPLLSKCPVPREVELDRPVRSLPGPAARGGGVRARRDGVPWGLAPHAHPSCYLSR